MTIHVNFANRENIIHKYVTDDIHDLFIILVCRGVKKRN